LPSGVAVLSPGTTLERRFLGPLGFCWVGTDKRDQALLGGSPLRPRGTISSSDHHLPPSLGTTGRRKDPVWDVSPSIFGRAGRAPGGTARPEVQAPEFSFKFFRGADMLPLIGDWQTWGGDDFTSSSVQNGRRKRGPRLPAKDSIGRAAVSALLFRRDRRGKVTAFENRGPSKNR